MAKTKSGVRSPTAHRTLEQMRKHADTYGQSEAYKKNHAARMRMRRKMEREGKVSKNDGMDVDHKRPMSKGGTNTTRNVRVVPRGKNRGHGISPGGTRRGTRAK